MGEFKFGYFKNFGEQVMLHQNNNELFLIIHPIYEHWIYSIYIDGFFPCRMDKCRKVCKMIVDYAFEEAEDCFKTLHKILQEILISYRNAGTSLSYIKTMKRNIDYIERMAKDG